MSALIFRDTNLTRRTRCSDMCSLNKLSTCFNRATRRPAEGKEERIPGKRQLILSLTLSRCSICFSFSPVLGLRSLETGTGNGPQCAGYRLLRSDRPPGWCAQWFTPNSGPRGPGRWLLRMASVEPSEAKYQPTKNEEAPERASELIRSRTQHKAIWAKRR